MCKIYISILVIGLALISCKNETKPVVGIAYHYTNGKWYDGEKFTSKDYYAVNGVFTSKKPNSSKLITEDLKGQFVVPPLGEAHNHNFGSGDVSDTLALKRLFENYCKNGVLYGKIPGNSPANKLVVQRVVLRDSIPLDISFGDNIVTAKDGHPIGRIISAFKRYNLPKPDLEEMDGKEFVTIESEEDIHNKWNIITASKPDFIKTVLRYSEDYEARRKDSSNFGRNGINPKLLPTLVKKAHDSGLRITIHINSSHDFATAVKAGVDEIAHMPFKFGKNKKLEDCLITDEMAELAKEKNINVVTTALVATFFAKGEELVKVKEFQRKNIKMLLKHNVKMAVGSDKYDDISVQEFEYLKALNVFSNKELLDLWTTQTTEAIFPDRKIGYLKDNYEANFITLKENPLQNIETLFKPILIFKNGKKWYSNN